MTTRPPLKMDEAAALFRVCTKTLREMVARGEVRVVRVGQRRMMIPADEVDRILEGEYLG